MQTSSGIKEKSLGAYVSIEQLTGFRFAAKKLSLIKNKKALKHLAGPYKALSRGRGMEFEGVRQYQPGDDIRTIDWRVTARVGKAHTKQFQEEKEIPALVIVDQRQSMFFGSQSAMKSVLACDTASFLSWAVLDKGDQLGGLIFNDSEEFEIRPKRQRKNVLKFLHALSNFNSSLSNKNIKQQRHLSSALAEISRLSKPGFQIFIISDFYDFDTKCSGLLYEISKHNDVIAIAVNDPLEQKLPPSGYYQVSNGTEMLLFDSNNKKVRDNYQAHFKNHQAFLKNEMGKYNIPLIPISTPDNALTVLQKYLGVRRG